MPKAPKMKVSQTNKVIHPKSRKAGQMVRQTHHEDKVERRRDERHKKLELLAEKFRFFQAQLIDEETELSKEDVLQILDRYFHRFDEELEQISIINSIGGRNGQRHASREQTIKLTQQTEKTEFETIGTEVPDLVNRKNLETFRAWTGEIRFLPNMKLKRLSLRDKTVLETTPESSSGRNSTDYSEKR